MLPAALAVDLALGDPATRWHPVRVLGTYAAWIESRVRVRAKGYLGGLLAFLLVVGFAVTAVAAWLALARRIHPILEFAIGVGVVFVSIAPRDLASHALRVLRALEKRELDEARRAVGAIVGRDTVILDETEVSRAAVETVAESTVDGITAPLFWACLLGPLGAFAYRVINTLDSMWGHRDERYARFGTVAARADDIANYVPARLTLVGIVLASLCLRLNARDAWLAAVRQSKGHASPNSGIPEAAFAGALAITLGGRNRYDGEWHESPTFGFASARPEPRHVAASLRLMWVTTVLTLCSLTVARAAFETWVIR